MTERMPHVLIVDDDARFVDLLERFFRKEGWRASSAFSAAQARSLLEELAFDLITLDVMMPAETGLEFAASLASLATPILMLSARGEGADRVSGLEAGARDYMTKPFEPRELLLRARNLLRDAPESITRFGDCAFDAALGLLTRGGASVALTESERNLLRRFVGARGRSLSRAEIAACPPAAPGERAADVRVNRLRRKLEADPKRPLYLQTVRGKGYVLVAD